MSSAKTDEQNGAELCIVLKNALMDFQNIKRMADGYFNAELALLEISKICNNWETHKSSLTELSNSFSISRRK